MMRTFRKKCVIEISLNIKRFQELLKTNLIRLGINEKHWRTCIFTVTFKVYEKEFPWSEREAREEFVEMSSGDSIWRGQLCWDD